MPPTVYRFEIEKSVPLAEAEMSLHLAMIALEGLFSAAGLRLDARYSLDEPGRAIVVDGSTPVGASLVKVFTTLLTREFGEECFAVRRVSSDAHAPLAAEEASSPVSEPAGV